MLKIWSNLPQFDQTINHGSKIAPMASPSTRGIGGGVGTLVDVSQNFWSWKMYFFRGYCGIAHPYKCIVKDSSKCILDILSATYFFWSFDPKLCFLWKTLGGLGGLPSDWMWCKKLGLNRVKLRVLIQEQKSFVNMPKTKLTLVFR